MTLDPLACEVVRDDDDERLTFELSCRGAVEPRLESGVVECVPQARGNFGPQQFRAQLYRTIHPLDSLLARLPGAATIAASMSCYNGGEDVNPRRKRAGLQGVLELSTSVSTMWITLCYPASQAHSRLWIVGPPKTFLPTTSGPSLYWLRSPGAASSLGLIREANLSTERPPEEAPARVPRKDADPGRPRDSEASPCQGTQAPFRLRRRPRGA